MVCSHGKQSKFLRAVWLHIEWHKYLKCVSFAYTWQLKKLSEKFVHIIVLCRMLCNDRELLRVEKLCRREPGAEPEWNKYLETLDPALVYRCKESSVCFIFFLTFGLKKWISLHFVGTVISLSLSMLIWRVNVLYFTNEERGKRRETGGKWQNQNL